MPDVSPQPAQPRLDRPGPNGNVAAAGGRAEDSLSKLHRMSRTAGVGTQDYVAINVAAVIALLLGVASALALVASLLLVIPIAGVVCGIVALYQINDSNGTQTGRGIAWSGIALSVLFAAVVGGREGLDQFRTRNDRQAVIATVATFGDKLEASEFKAAYDHFGPRIRERVSMSDFEGQMKARYAHPRHGRVTRFESAGLVIIERDPETGIQIAETQAVIDLEYGADDRSPLTLVFEDGQWLIEAWGWFPPQPPQITPAGPGL